jgi:hypothetical protein
MGLSLKRAMEAQEGDTMEPQGPLPAIAGRAPAPAEAPAEGGERPAPPMGGGAPRPERSMGGAPRQDRGGGGPRQDRGDRGRRGEEAERAQMPAQPQLETAMAAAMAAAMGQTAEPEAPALPAPGQSVNEEGPGGYLEQQARETAEASAASIEEGTPEAGTERAFTDLQEGMAEATGPAEEAAAVTESPFTDMQEGMAEATGPAEEAAAVTESTFTDVQEGMAEATGPAEEVAASEPLSAEMEADLADARSLEPESGTAENAAAPEDETYESQMGPGETVTPATEDEGPDTDTATS